MVCTVVFVSNPTTVLRLCCVVVGTKCFCFINQMCELFLFLFMFQMLEFPSPGNGLVTAGSRLERNVYAVFLTQYTQCGAFSNQEFWTMQGDFFKGFASDSLGHPMHHYSWEQLMCLISYFTGKINSDVLSVIQLETFMVVRG